MRATDQFYTIVRSDQHFCNFYTIFPVSKIIETPLLSSVKQPTDGLHIIFSKISKPPVLNFKKMNINIVSINLYTYE